MSMLLLMHELIIEISFYHICGQTMYNYNEAFDFSVILNKNIKIRRKYNTGGSGGLMQSEGQGQKYIKGTY